MPIRVVCGGCGKRFKAPDRGAGKSVPCPSCKTIISIPADTTASDDEEYRLAEEPAVTAKSSAAAPASAPSTSGRSAARQLVVPPARSGETISEERAGGGEVAGAIPETASRRAWVPPTKSSTPTWLRHLHWWLALAMIPLAVSVFMPDESGEELTERVLRSFATSDFEDAPMGSGDSDGASSTPPNATTDLQGNSGGPTGDLMGAEDADSDLSLDDLLALLPAHKLEGAFLARDSYAHWLFALAAAVGYMTFLVFLASDRSAKPLHLLGLGLFTATGGILLLLFVQLASTIGVLKVRGPGAFIVLVLALIGLSYGAAMDPDTGFVASFIGFTCGVGLCEEVCKALPILIFYRIGTTQNWRGAFLWGLASGTGFGVSEGIMYSQDFYNGIAGAGIYIVRFVSCVALHAIWAGSIGISIHQRQDLLQEDLDEWWWYGLAVLRLIAIPAILHGLYDTLLKKELELLALVVAGASFGYLAWQISHLRHSDDEDERAAHVSKYIRSKVAAQGA